MVMCTTPLTFRFNPLFIEAIILTKQMSQWPGLTPKFQSSLHWGNYSDDSVSKDLNWKVSYAFQSSLHWGNYSDADYVYETEPVIGKGFNPLFIEAIILTIARSAVRTGRLQVSILSSLRQLFWPNKVAYPKPPVCRFQSSLHWGNYSDQERHLGGCSLVVFCFNPLFIEAIILTRCLWSFSRAKWLSFNPLFIEAIILTY